MPLVSDPAGDLDVIVARATPPGVSALAVVRMSGPEGEPRRILSALAPQAASIRAREARFVRLSDHEGEPLDEAVVLFFAKEASPTGEEVVEISCHGSPAVVAALVESLVRSGARPARAGEFSRRALRNGKLDLARAEGLLALLTAESRRRASHAYGLLRGHLSERIHGFRDRILDLLAVLEASLDFAEDLPEVAPGTVVPELRKIEADLNAFLRLTDVVRDGDDLPRVVLLGRPNAGKSTLFNALLGIDRAIVTPQPGTTRDALRESVFWSGQRVTLHDTAGLRETSEEIERIGVEVARQAAESADLVLYLVDSETGLETGDREVLARLGPERTLVVFSKSDRARQPLGVVEGWEGIPVSALTGAGMEDLRRRAISRLGILEREPGAALLKRQRDALERAAQELSLALSGREPLAPELWAPEVRASALRRALAALGEITGETATEDLLDRIFSKFCVGK